ncbi:TrmB family transcriptional regulator [halophilic archaeon]|nr:TrmB family transcriptional regulator [halophilic archaeon]
MVSFDDRRGDELDDGPRESDAETEVYECGDCGTVAPEPDTCCDRPMATVAATPVREPDLQSLLRNVFGISGTGLDICVRLMRDGESTVPAVAEALDLDRSTVARQVNHLVEVGVLEKRQRLLSQGGYVHVYSPKDVEVVRRRLERGLAAWTREAKELVEDVNRAKVEAAAEMDREEPSGIYWDA